MTSEPRVKEEVQDVDMEEDNGSEHGDGLLQSGDDPDPVVKEIDVYLAKTLANKIFVLQVMTNSIWNTFIYQFNI